MKLSELEAWCKERRVRFGRDLEVLFDPDEPGTDYQRIRTTQETVDLETDELFILLAGLPW